MPASPSASPDVPQLLGAPRPEPGAVSVVIVGAGPRATGLLERIAANADELWPGGRRLEIQLVDPYPAGPGRIWRHDQSPLLRMNSMAEDVTMFTDSGCDIEGPIRPGPSLAEWAAAVSGRAARQLPHTPPADPGVRAELARLAPTDFPTRRTQSAYLDWALRRALAELPPHITVRVHRTTALALDGPPDGPQSVTLAGRPAPLTADLVILTQGHLGSLPRAEHSALEAFARRHGRVYVPPAFTADADLSAIAPGEHVVLRGLGLAFVDVTSLLTEGRGGRFREEPDGTLSYLPSGREPVLHAGSRRGVPYHSKTDYQLQGPRPPLPRYFGPCTVERLAADGRPAPLDLRGDLWPLMAKEIGFGHYHELFHAHPHRTARSWDEFLAAYDRHDWYGQPMRDLIAAAVPDPADRLDFEALDHPLAGLTFPTPEAFQRHIRQYVTADTARRADPAHSADLGAFLALLSVYGQLPGIVAAGGLTAHSVRDHVDGWWQGFFSFLASGPPGFRLRELLALSRAGVVRFTGAGLRVETDEHTGTFLASGASVPGHTVRATALVEAYLPTPSLDRTEDPLLRRLYGAGEAGEEIIEDASGGYHSGRLATVLPDGRILAPGGGPHPRRIALGHATNGRAVAAFARPRTNAPAFRQNDSVARTLLRTLSAPRSGSGMPAQSDALLPGGTT